MLICTQMEQALVGMLPTLRIINSRLISENPSSHPFIFPACPGVIFPLSPNLVASSGY
jgi:hypothetical protein